MKKKYFYILFIIVIIVAWLWIVSPLYKNIEKNKVDNHTSVQLSKNTTSTGVQNIIRDTKKDNELIALLEKEDFVINEAIKNDFWVYTEELPVILTYYTDKAPDMFSLYQSFKDIKKTTCSKIKEQNLLDLCTSLSNINGGDKAVIKKVLWDYRVKLTFDSAAIDDITNILYGIRNNNCTTQMDMSSYLTCRKVLDEKFDVQKYLLKYMILKKSNQYVVTKNYQDILEIWGMSNDKDFMTYIQNVVIKK